MATNGGSSLALNLTVPSTPTWPSLEEAISILAVLASRWLIVQMEPEAESQEQVVSDKKRRQLEKAAAEKAAREKAEADKRGLLFACFYSKHDEIRRYLKGGLGIESANDSGWTPLLTVAWHSNNPATIALLHDEFGAALEAQNEFGWTPLICAAMNAKLPCLKELLVRGASLEARTKAGKTAKDYALEMGEQRAEVLALLQKAETVIGKAALESESLPTFCLWFLVSCPPASLDAAVAVMENGRVRNVLAPYKDGSRSSEDAWNLWRERRTDAIISALRSAPKVHQALVIYLEDGGAKICKDEWAEWANLEKALETQLKTLQAERDQEGDAGREPISIELFAPQPMSIEDFEAHFKQ